MSDNLYASSLFSKHLHVDVDVTVYGINTKWREVLFCPVHFQNSGSDFQLLDGEKEKYLVNA